MNMRSHSLAEQILVAAWAATADIRPAGADATASS